MPDFSENLPNKFINFIVDNFNKYILGKEITWRKITKFKGPFEKRVTWYKISDKFEKVEDVK